MATEQLIPRRTVIEEYVRYDARKKDKPIPQDLNEWDWSSAYDLDNRLKAAGFKDGVHAGYTLWKVIELDLSALAHCAVEARIFPGLPRPLGQIALSPEFQRWTPDRNTEWFDHLDRGGEYPRDWPLILRPAVASEFPAKWYIEDGSGRAICFYRRLVRTSDYNSRAYGYLGATPDRNSTFMQTNFRELIASHRHEPP